MMQTVEAYRQVNEVPAANLVEEHALLVKRIAHHLAARLPDHVAVEDLIQCGMMRLIEAANDYDPTRNASFATYAGICVRGAMMDEIRSNTWAPRSVHRRSREISNAMTQLRAELGRDATPQEISDALDITLAEYFRALDGVSRGKLLSLDDLLSRETGNAVEPRDDGDDPSESVSRQELAQRLAAAIKTLSEREQQVVSLYYVDELNLREIGAVLGVSESRVCQINTQLLLRLRSRLSEY